jgi:hypothetical protein
VLRTNSRLMVDAGQFSFRPIARTLHPCCFMLAMVMRSSGWSYSYFQGDAICAPYTERVLRFRFEAAVRFALREFFVTHHNGLVFLSLVDVAPA